MKTNRKVIPLMQRYLDFTPKTEEPTTFSPGPFTEDEIYGQAELSYISKWLFLHHLPFGPEKDLSWEGHIKYYHYNNLIEAFKQISTAGEMDVNSGKEDSMDWQEKYINSLDQSVRDIKNEMKEVRSEIKESFHATEGRITNMLNQTLSELRDRDNQRHQEYISIKDDISSTRRWVIGIVISIFIGITGLAIANYQFITSLVQLLKP